METVAESGLEEAVRTPPWTSWNDGPRDRGLPGRKDVGRAAAFSILIGAQDLATGPAAEGAVGRHVDRLLEEMDGPVNERKVGTAGVVALEACVCVRTARRPVARAPTVA